MLLTEPALRGVRTSGLAYTELELKRCVAKCKIIMLQKHFYIARIE